jgi:DNA-binding protein H-NS
MIIIGSLHELVIRYIIAHLQILETRRGVMASRNAASTESFCEWLEIDLDTLNESDKIGVIGEMLDSMRATDIIAVREMAVQKARDKMDEAKAEVIAEMREKFDQLGLPFEETLGIKKQLPPKYMSPDGVKTWSGRGYAPAWIRDFEEQGHDREEYLIASHD